MPYLKVKTGFIFLIIFLILPVSVSSQWIQKNTGSNTALFSCFFLNAETGWVGGQDSPGRIFYTSNGGNNWQLIYSTSSSERFEVLYFINQQTGFASSWWGTIYKTTNGGYNWSTYLIYPGQKIYGINFTDSQTGWLIGEMGYKKTTNCGAFWTSTGFSSTGNCVYFFNQLTGIISANTGMYKTTDGGSSFTSTFTWSNLYIIYSVNFINQNTGFAVGNRSLTLKTTNGGNSWEQRLLDTTNENHYHDIFYSCSFISQDLGYASGQNILSNIGGTTTNPILKKTTNGGYSWNSVPLPYDSDLYSCGAVQIVDGQTGYVVGYKGRVLKSTNAGIVGFENETSKLPSSSSLSQNYPNPFNPVSKIKFQIAKQSYSILKIYDILGKEITTLVDNNLKPGVYDIDWNASDYPSGVYFYKLISGDFTETKKMILLK